MNKNKNKVYEVADDNQQGAAQAKMPCTSKSNRRRRAKKSKFVGKLKQQIRNWLELPLDIMANILHRVGVYDILETAQQVCTTWRKICKDPTMWRVISMDTCEDPYTRQPLRKMCKHAVDRSQGQLLDLTITDFVDNELLEYVAERSSHLKRLEIIYCSGRICRARGDVLKKFPLLEELSLCGREISEEDIEDAGRYCPLLKTFRVNQNPYMSNNENDYYITRQNALAIAIGKTLPALRHLELIGNLMSDIGLKAILDGCCHLETLDLRRCFNIDLTGHMGKKCARQIKNLKLPCDSLEDCPHIYTIFYKPFDVNSDSGSYLDDYPEYFDYDKNDDYHSLW